MGMRIRVHVPATTANLGPGFDCLGLALDWWNTITVEPAQALTVRLRGFTEGLPADATNMTVESMALLYGQLGRPLPPVRVTMTNRIPIGCGLGSSAAALVGGLVAANALAGTPFTGHELLEIAHEQEGHPDNVSAALFGGLTISAFEGARVVTAHVVPAPTWRAVLYVPDHALSTLYARQILPDKVSRADAVFNIGRAALVAFAFTARQVGFLQIGTQDRLHQPYRQSLVPGMRELLDAACASGASGAALSGAGPSLIAFGGSPEQAARVARAFRATARQLGLNGAVRVVALSERGAYFERI